MHIQEPAFEFPFLFLCTIFIILQVKSPMTCANIRLKNNQLFIFLKIYLFKIFYGFFYAIPFCGCRSIIYTGLGIPNFLAMSASLKPSNL